MSGTFASLLPTQANRFSQMYVNGFVDVSCGNVLLRGDAGANHLILQNGDISLNGRLFSTRDISLNGNLNIGGNLSVSQFSSNKTITTTNYQLVVAEDLSLNGRLFVSSDASFGGNLFVKGTTNLGGALYTSYKNTGASITSFTIGYNSTSITNSSGTYTYTGGSTDSNGVIVAVNGSMITGAYYTVSITCSSTISGTSIQFETMSWAPIGYTVVTSTLTTYTATFTATSNMLYLRVLGPSNGNISLVYNAFTLTRLDTSISSYLGIGTTAPAYTLDVSAASTAPFRVGVGSTNAIAVNSSGNVGIGTTTPAYKLDIRTSNLSTTAGTTYSQNMIIATDYGTTGTYSSTVGGFLQGGTVANQSTFLALGTCSGSQAASLAEKMRIVDTGCVGIGTTSPGAMLDVRGSVAGSTPGGGYNYRGDGYGGRFGGAGFNAAIYANNDIVAAGWFVAGSGSITLSDKRIKTNINNIDSAISKLRMLIPRHYEYIDKIKMPKATNGFIAQEVKLVIPEAVKVSTEYIPNIYDFADVSNNVITLKTKTTDTFLLDDSGNLVTNIKVYDDNKDVRCKIVSIIDNHSFTIDEAVTSDVIFVYGQEVTDLLSLDKDSIFTITTAAVQQIDREFQEAKQTIQTLESENTDLKSRLTSLEARLSAAGF